MGGQVQETGDEVNTAKGESQIRGLKSDAEEIKEGYKSLKTKVEGNKRSIVGLTTEMEEVRKRIRELLNKRVSAAGPVYDEYKINQKFSNKIEPVDIPTRRAVSSSSRSSSSANGGTSTEESSVVVEESSTPSSVSIKVTTKTTTTSSSSEVIEE